MTNDEHHKKDAFDKMIEMINANTFDIETIDSKDSQTRAILYKKLRDILETRFPEILDTIKFSGKEELDRLESKLKSNPNSLKYKVLRIIRAIFYC